MCCLSGSSKTAPVQLPACQLFILCEIHCYFCPHIFWVYYFSLSQCVLYILCTERISLEDGKKLEEDCRSICVSHFEHFFSCPFIPFPMTFCIPVTLFYLSLTQICLNQMQKLFNLHTMCPWKIRRRKKNEAKYNDTFYVEMQKMTMTLEFQGFVG